MIFNIKKSHLGIRVFILNCFRNTLPVPEITLEKVFADM